MKAATPTGTTSHLKRLVGMPICNATLSYPADLREILLQSPLLRFDEVRERGSSAVKRYMTTTKYRDLSFVVYPNRVIIKGSWAKFHNHGQHNYTPYTLEDLRGDIADLSGLFAYDFSGGRIHGVEVGVNLYLADLPQPYFTPEFIIPRLVSFQGRQPLLPMKTIRGAGQGVECSLTNYRIKIYDKGTQYHRPEPILRFEYDCNQVKELRPLGIGVLSDLVEPGKLVTLGEKLRGLFADCILVEPVDDSNLSPAERKLYSRAELPSFWRDLSRRNRAYYLQGFRELIEIHSTVHLHRTLTESVKYEWDELTRNCNVFMGSGITPTDCGEVADCNIFLPISCGECYDEPARQASISFPSSSVQKQAADEAEGAGVILTSLDGERRCEVTGNALDEKQPMGSKVIGITTLRKNPGLVRQLRQRFGHKTRKRGCHAEEYYLAHGLRNVKSNAPNNLLRRVKKAIDNTPLFPAEDVVRLTVDQKNTLSYFARNPLAMDVLRTSI